MRILYSCLRQREYDKWRRKKESGRRRRKEREDRIEQKLLLRCRTNCERSYKTSNKRHFNERSSIFFFFYQILFPFLFRVGFGTSEKLDGRQEKKRTKKYFKSQVLSFYKNSSSNNRKMHQFYLLWNKCQKILGEHNCHIFLYFFNAGAFEEFFYDALVTRDGIFRS